MPNMKLTLLHCFILMMSFTLQGMSMSFDDCSMSNESAVVHMNMDDHSDHDMMVAAPQTQSHDCCEESCECAMASGQTAIAHIKPTLIAIMYKKQSLGFISKFISPGFPDAIYRPPNLA